VIKKREQKGETRDLPGKLEKKGGTGAGEEVGRVIVKLEGCVHVVLQGSFQNVKQRGAVGLRFGVPGSWIRDINHEGPERPHSQKKAS